AAADSRSALPPLEPLAPVADPEAIDRLLALSNPREAELSSHRGRLAPAVLVVKRVVQRLLTPVLDRQMLFNQRLAAWLGEVGGEIDKEHIRPLPAPPPPREP